MVTTHTNNQNPRITAIKRRHRLPAAQAMLLDLLLDGEIISLDKMVEAGIAPTHGTARVIVCRLRKNLEAPWQVEIPSLYQTGYWLEKESIARLLEDLKELLPEQVNGGG